MYSAGKAESFWTLSEKERLLTAFDLVVPRRPQPNVGLSGRTPTKHTAALLAWEQEIDRLFLLLPQYRSTGRAGPEGS
jgi:hypothetical protein